MKILLLKSFGIGNLVELTPVIKALSLNGHECYLISDAGPLGCKAKQILHHWEYIKDIWEFNREENPDGGEIMRWIKDIAPDLCIVSYPHDTLFNWLIPLLNIPVRKSLHGNSHWFQHEVDYNFELVKDLVSQDSKRSYDLPLWKKGFPKVAEVMLKSDKPNLVICPAYKREGLWWKKNWGIENFAGLVEGTSERFNVILLDGPDGISECQLINFLAGNKATNLAGKLTIQESMQLLSMADLVVSNDTGMAHVAAAYQRNLLVFFGPTSIVKNVPIGKNTTVVQSDLACQPCHGTEAWSRCLEPLCLSSITPGRMIEFINSYYKEDDNGNS